MFAFVLRKNCCLKFKLANYACPTRHLPNALRTGIYTFCCAILPQLWDSVLIDNGAPFAGLAY